MAKDTLYSCNVSIHADLRRGRRRCSATLSARRHRFQSTPTSEEVGDLYPAFQQYVVGVSIHADLRRGRRQATFLHDLDLIEVSIHADLRRGRRPLFAGHELTAYLFQSTPTSEEVGDHRRGARTPHCSSFNPRRPPKRSATAAFAAGQLVAQVSIHADLRRGRRLRQRRYLKIQESGWRWREPQPGTNQKLPIAPVAARYS
jgi:hypothetical protein